jgi:hypothetical protein
MFNQAAWDRQFEADCVALSIAEAETRQKLPIHKVIKVSTWNEVGFKEGVKREYYELEIVLFKRLEIRVARWGREK